jgi:DNA-binding NtrC family response regulator
MTNSPRILVIDDHPGVLDFMVMALKAAGYAPQGLSDSREALRVLQENRFDLVVSDIVMPYLHGLELLEAAKRQDPSTRVLFVTGYPNQTIVGEALNKGASGIVEKPFEMEEFLAMVRQILQ